MELTEKVVKQLYLNLNDTVYVRLNELGHSTLRKEHEDTFKDSKKFPYQSPQIDADGYCKFPLWELMRIFGPTMQLGMLVPFENCGIVVKIK